MKKGSLFLLLLLVFRICLVPTGFAHFSNDLKNLNYEQVNIKKRHSPAHGLHTYMAEALNWSSVACISVQRPVSPTSKKLRIIFYKKNRL